MHKHTSFIETIRIENGRVRNIHYHNERFNRTRALVFKILKVRDLRKFINVENAPGPLVKCRITYAKQILKVEYEPYQLKPIRTLKLIEVASVDYVLKYADRSSLSAFYDQKDDCDDILMTRNGFVADTYFANVAFKKEESWYTPKSPLLAGTCRARLLATNRIVKKDIHMEEINSYSSLCVFNAMIDFGTLTLSIDQVIP